MPIIKATLCSNVLYMQYTDDNNIKKEYDIASVIEEFGNSFISFINRLNYQYDNVLNDDDIDDVIQEIYIKLVSGALEKFKGKCSLKNYLLYHVARTVFLDFLRKKYSTDKSLVYTKNSYATSEDDVLIDYPDDNRVIPEHIFNRNEFMTILKEELNNLSAMEKTIFAMIEFDGLKQSEVADKLKIRQPTVSEHYTNARLKLQKILTSKYSEYICEK